MTGFSDEDLKILWNALINMFDMDHSAARGNMATRKLIVFRHESELGNAPATALFDRVKAVRRNAEKAPRAYSDYEITINKSDLPAGVTIEELL